MSQKPHSVVLKNCLALRTAYEKGLLGNMRMPEDARPKFTPADTERRLVYFTLPMSLNYQRNSYAHWEAATKTFLDPETTDVFSVKNSSDMSTDLLRAKLTKHKVALQPNKHVDTWKRLSETFHKEWEDIGSFLKATDYDFRQMRTLVQERHKKGFPYLSGPKIFHYWSYILIEYCGVKLKNRALIEIAPDTHVLQASVKLGVLKENEATDLTRDQVSERWRSLLEGSSMSPIDMHSPLWFWSRNSFQYELR